MSWHKHLTVLFLLCIVAQTLTDSFRIFGPYGEWKHYYRNPDAFICGVRLQYQAPLAGYDNTGINGIGFIFCNRDNWYRQYEDRFTGFWGQWLTNARYLCPSQYYVDSVQLRIDYSNVDNTGLNGIRITCGTVLGSNAYPWSFEGDRGVWSRVCRPNF